MRGENLVQWVVEREVVKKPFQLYADIAGPDRFPIAHRYVAGEDVAAATAYVDEELNPEITALVDILGEHVEDVDTVAAVQDDYEQLLRRITEQGLDAELSIKLTHLGLDVDDRDDPYAYCRENVQGLVEQSAAHDRRLWIDMESADYTDDTIAMYDDLLDDHDNVGLCLQSYLDRTAEDVDDLKDRDGAIRLVKGAYPEDADYTGEELNERYRTLLHELFAGDTYVAVATHDHDLIDHAQALEQAGVTATDAFEFQFLKGIRDDRKPELVEDGYSVAEYVPYGDDWFDYLWRRVQEDPSNLTKAVRG